MVEVVSSEILKCFEKGPIRRSFFSNGATTLFHQFKGMEGAFVKVCFIAGSAYEKESEHGLSHVLEHMIFKEEKNRPFLKDIESFGANINAYTDKEIICFELSCSAKNLSQLYYRFLDLVFCKEFDQKNLLLEKKVIRQELREDKSDFELFGLEHLFEKNFKRELGHKVGGNLSDINKIKTDDLKKYYKKFFIPQRMTVSVVSGHQFKNFELESLKVFDSWQRFNSRPSSFKVPVKPRKLNRVSILHHFNSRLKRDIESSIVFYSFNGPTLTSSVKETFLVLDDLLFAGMTSVFYKKMREELALVYGLGSFLNTYSQEGSYVFVFYVEKKNISRLDRVVFETLNTLLLSSKLPFLMAQSALRLGSELNLSMDNLSERCEYITFKEIYGHGEFSLSKVIEKFYKVTEKDLKRLIKSLITRPYSRLVMGK